MSVLVGTSGFFEDDFSDAGAIVSLETLMAAPPGSNRLGLDIANTTDAGILVPHFGQLALIRISFPGMADGRGFSLARRLRQLGFRGRLRARGPVIPDQFRAALRVGFDEVEISDDQALRQPEDQWLAVRQMPSYQSRVRNSAA
jgi:uncharacterized protein (DUF934 family)